MLPNRRVCGQVRSISFDEGSGFFFCRAFQSLHLLTVRPVAWNFPQFKGPLGGVLRWDRRTRILDPRGQ